MIRAFNRMPELLRFCVVGGIGFLTDAGGLELLVMCGWPTLLARVVSMFIALQVAYGLHGAFTFRDHDGYRWRGWVHFMACNGFGAGLNYAVFWVCLRLIDLPWEVLVRQSSLVIGTVVGLLFNYWANRRFVFRAKR